MLQDKIQADLTAALKEKNDLWIQTLRMLLAAVHNRQIELRGLGKELNDEEIWGVISCEVKKHQESIEAFQKGARADLVEKEEKERQILQSYLPAQLSEEAIREIVKSVISEVGASGAADFGRVMGQVMAQVKGQAEGGTVSRIVRESLEQITNNQAPNNK